MKLILVRHGESALNRVGIHQFPDSPLSDVGKEQAISAAKSLKNIRIGRIMASNYKRAMQTANIISKYTGKKVVYSRLMAEWKRPSAIQGKMHESKIAIRIAAQMKAHSNNPFWHHSDEENFYEFRERVLKIINMIENRREKTLVVVTHSEVICMIIGIVLMGEDIAPSEFNKLKKTLIIANAGISVIEKNREGLWKVLALNHSIGVDYFIKYD
jgi:broad specificity phosphatase PhoE